MSHALVNNSTDSAASAPAKSDHGTVVLPVAAQRVYVDAIRVVEPAIIFRNANDLVARIHQQVGSLEPTLPKP